MTARRHAHQYESVPTSESGLNTIQPIIGLSALPMTQGQTRYDHTAGQRYAHCGSYRAEDFVVVRAQTTPLRDPEHTSIDPRYVGVRRDIDVRKAGRCTARKFTSSG